MSQILSVRIDQENPTSEEVRIAAYQCAANAGVQGVCLVQVQIPGLEAASNVVVNTASGEATVVLPVPYDLKALEHGAAVYFPSGIYYVTKHSAESEILHLQTLAADGTPLFIIELEPETAFIHAFRADGDDLKPVLRSAESAAAAAIILHRDLQDGTMEVTVGQPGGILEIGMRKEEGKITGLSAGGPVEVSV